MKTQLRKSQQVAAVCYRVRNCRVEFLLVRTRGGRWIFPKGGVEYGLTHAQSAAIEAVEEAGVHGRIEIVPFTHYLRRPDKAVAAHLCEVSRLETPKESDRNPSWFSAEETKQRLLEDRASEFGAELAVVVDRALARIHRLNREIHTAQHTIAKDALQAVHFEAFEAIYRRGPMSHFRSRRGNVYSALSSETQEQARSLRQPNLGINIQRRVLQLGDGGVFGPDNHRKVTTIDSRVRTKSPKARLLPTNIRKAERKPKSSNERSEPQ